VRFITWYRIELNPLPHDSNPPPLPTSPLVPCLLLTFNWLVHFSEPNVALQMHSSPVMKQLTITMNTRAGSSLKMVSMVKFPLGYLVSYVHGHDQLSQYFCRISGFVHGHDQLSQLALVSLENSSTPTHHMMHASLKHRQKGYPTASGTAC